LPSKKQLIEQIYNQILDLLYSDFFKERVFNKRLKFGGNNQFEWLILAQDDINIIKVRPAHSRKITHSSLELYALNDKHTTLISQPSILYSFTMYNHIEDENKVYKALEYVYMMLKTIFITSI